MQAACCRLTSRPTLMPAPAQVLVALQRLTFALGPESPAAYPLLLPVLRLCTDPAQPDELNLLEDGLQLWLVALRCAPSQHAELLSLFPNLVRGQKCMQVPYISWQQRA